MRSYLFHAHGLPRDIDEHIRLMCDILVLAFQWDTTPPENPHDNLGNSRRKAWKKERIEATVSRVPEMTCGQNQVKCSRKMDWLTGLVLSS